MFINLYSSRAFPLMEVIIKTSVVKTLDSSPFFSSSSLDLFHCPWAKPLETYGFQTLWSKDRASSVPNKRIKTRSGVVDCNEGRGEAEDNFFGLCVSSIKMP